MKTFAWQRDGIVLAFAMLAPSLFTWLYFIVYAGQGSVTQFLYLASKVVLGVVPIWWHFQIRKKGALNSVHREQCITNESLPGPPHYSMNASGTGMWNSLLAGLLFGAITFISMQALYSFFLKGSPALVGTADAVHAKLMDAGVSSIGSFVGLALFLSILHAAFEEYYWRWFIFGRLREGMNWFAAALVTALAFAFHHVIILGAYIPASHVWLIVVCSLSIALGGLVWSIIYQKTGSLLGAWVAHICADLGIMWCGYDLCKGYLT